MGTGQIQNCYALGLRCSVPLVDIADKILGLAPITTLFPLSSVPHTSCLSTQPDGTTGTHTQISASRNTIPQQAHAVSAVILAHTLIEGSEINPMFQGAVFDEGLSGNELIVAFEAHGETKIDLRIGILGCSAKEEDIAQAFSLAVHTLNAIVFVGSPKR